MRTFAELLTEYMARTGISDSELARTLGVRRQTIFRWKEGLVEKPRYREDILRVADRLRLLPKERDELLLAAGFAPEAPVPASPPEPILIAEQPEATLEPPPMPRRTFRPALVGVAALALVILIGLLLLSFQPGAGPTYPRAGPGESLVVIGAMGSAQAAVETPSRKLPSENAPSTKDVSDSLRTALDREIQASRLEHVRAVVWPQSIGDADAAEAIRHRSGARIVIGGALDRSELVVSFAVAPAASRANALPLDALVSPPLDIPLKISTTPEDVQMVALLALGQVQADQGDFDLARAALTLAVSHSSEPTPAVLYAYQGYLSQIDEPPDLGQAVQFYSQTLNLAPNALPVLVNRGVAYVRQNQPSQWQADFTRVLALSPDHFAAHAALCWAFALDKQPDRALAHCDMAVRLDPTARSRDARAIVYAEMSRFSDAVADWQAFLEWLAQQPESLRARYGSSRSDWLQKALAGHSPIDQPTLDKLRHE